MVARIENRRSTVRNRLLAAMGSSDFSLLAANLKDIALLQGSVLQETGEAIKYVYFLESGMVSLVTVMQDGSMVETATIGFEGAVGATSGLGSRIAPHRAVVQIGGRAQQISAAQFEAVVSGSASLKDLLVCYSDALMMMVQQSAGCNALHTVEARLARWILQARDRNYGDSLPLTQEYLAQMLGVRRTSVTIVARNLQKLGLIRYRRGKIGIIDMSGLEAKACECYAVLRRRNEEVFSRVAPD
jgi:CRP-like cAMP-binding protein